MPAPLVHKNQMTFRWDAQLVHNDQSSLLQQPKLTIYWNTRLKWTKHDLSTDETRTINYEKWNVQNLELADHLFRKVVENQTKNDS
jgi:hypothetical protein